VVVTRKLCRTARSSSVHKTESLSVMGHTRSAVVSYTGSDQKQHNFFVQILSFWSVILQGGMMVLLVGHWTWNS